MIFGSIDPQQVYPLIFKLKRILRYSVFEVQAIDNMIG